MAAATKPVGHTPGPWAVACDRHRHWGKREVLGPGVGGSLVVGFTISTNADAAKIAEVEANARLISAAPDLLAACELALLRFQHDGWPLNDENAAAIAMLEAGIAKARGQEPA